MGKPAAKEGDQVTGTCQHNTLMNSATGATSVLPYAFAGVLDGGLSQDVKIGGKAAAVVDSTASNKPAHVTQGESFVSPPGNKATIKQGSSSVRINGKAAARAGDPAETCDETKVPGTVQAVGTVNIGG